MATHLQVGQVVQTKIRLRISPYLYSRWGKNFFDVPEGTKGEVIDVKWKSRKGNRYLVDFIGFGSGFTQFSLLSPCSEDTCTGCALRFKCFTRKDKWWGNER